ncbi:dipeptide ABC transporter ATP-binding protein [Roseinatronobacter sp.]
MTQAGHPVLGLRDLSIALPHGSDRDFAVQDISLTVQAGECVCLVGESGSGKSITGQAIMGMIPPALTRHSGQVSFCGRALDLDQPHTMQALRGREIGMIFQEPTASLDPIMRVGAQIAEVLAVHGMRDRTQRRARLRQLLEAVHLPDPDRIAQSYPHELSGGQAQRIVIAMALAHDPKLIIADEPTTALDVTTQAEILRLLKGLQQAQGSGLLFITHDLGVVADIADHVIVMQHGRIVEQGRRDAFFSAPQHPYSRKLLAALPQRRPGTAQRPTTPPVVLEARDISLTYRKPAGLLGHTRVQAVRDVSLQLRRGQTHGIVGESGSGKSSFVRCLLHLERFDSGSVHIDGKDTAQWGGSLPRSIRQRLQIVLQDPYTALNPRQRIGDTIAEAAQIHGAGRSDARARARDLLELVGLTPAAYARYPHEFSGGQRQRICIARALAPEPEILIADEAVSALDVSIQAQILALFRDLQDRLGFAILFVTHDLRVASAICDDVTVMRAGRVVEQGPMARIFDAPGADYTRHLLDAMPDRQNFALSGVLAQSGHAGFSADGVTP